MARQIYIESGKRYGRLIVQDAVGFTARGDRKWQCLCDCGNTRVVAGGHLRDGATRSCGCIRSEVSRARMIERQRQLREQRAQLQAALAASTPTAAHAGS